MKPKRKGNNVNCICPCKIVKRMDMCHCATQFCLVTSTNSRQVAAKMFWRALKSIPNISIFHHAKSPASLRAVNVLKRAKGEGYPFGSGKALDFNLEVVEAPPNPDQMNIISSYNKAPASSLLASAHPASSDSAGDASHVHEQVSRNPMNLKWPIVVDWDNGRAVIGDSGEGDRTKSVILEGLRKDRDGS